MPTTGPRERAEEGLLTSVEFTGPVRPTAASPGARGPARVRTPDAGRAGPGPDASPGRPARGPVPGRDPAAEAVRAACHATSPDRFRPCRPWKKMIMYVRRPSIGVT
ncbi:hypothetical protein GCM10010140_24950 [Streptosporangium pseudovulgare]|uniref:Uncharacterized protein n=1 Tax=Streptosporangium pseudovulgare TaxID=35765 RepID=A0ABQ2QS28_9ACTN|nr:hypothetical protein GCM10010140_24950 [Streptosporangium pseudovulgare]